MRALLALALLACGAPKPTTPANTAPPPPTTPLATKPVDTFANPLVHCDQLAGLVDRVTECNIRPLDAELLEKSLAKWTDRASLAAIEDPTDRRILTRKYGAACAYQIERLGKRECKLVDATHLATVGAFLDAYYADRAVATPTGDPTLDGNLQHLVTLRDEMCACKDDACTGTVGSRLDGLLGSGTLRPLLASAAVTVAYLLDDLAKCRSAARFISGR